MCRKKENNNNGNRDIKHSAQDAKPLHEGWRVDNSQQERKASQSGETTKPKGR